MPTHQTPFRQGRANRLYVGLLFAAAGVLCLLLVVVFARRVLQPVQQPAPPLPTARSATATTRVPAPGVAAAKPAKTVPEPAIGAPITRVRTNNNHAVAVHAGSTKWTATIAQMKAAMDDGDREGALMLARQLMSAPDPFARREALEMLRWLGAEALPELTRMLADPSEELAQLALDAWLNNLAEVTDHAANVPAMTTAITTIRDPAARHALMMQISLLPDDIAGEYYSGMLDASNKEVVELAREYLAFMAQEPIETQADAARWIARLRQTAKTE